MQKCHKFSGIILISLSAITWPVPSVKTQSRHEAPHYLRVKCNIRQMVKDYGSRESTMKNPREKKYNL